MFQDRYYDGLEKNGCELVNSAETLLDEAPNHSQKEHEFDGVFGVTSTKRVRVRIRSTKTIREVSNGSVSGIHVLLLKEGMLLNFDVIIL